MLRSREHGVQVRARGVEWRRQHAVANIPNEEGVGRSRRRAREHHLTGPAVEVGRLRKGAVAVLGAAADWSEEDQCGKRGDGYCPSAHTASYFYADDFRLGS